MKLERQNRFNKQYFNFLTDPVYLRKPMIRTEEIILDASDKTTNIYCGFRVRPNVAAAIDKIPFVFYVDEEEVISYAIATFSSLY